ncbi:MAG: GntR family transcriptional regulator [Chloroflexota bacterium]
MARRRPIGTEDPLDALRGLPAASRTLSQSVADRLRRLIVTGRLQPGDPLRLATIAARLDVSVQPVREAVRLLAAEGLVVIEPHRGAYVARLSVEDVEELYAVRIALEGLIARVAAERLTDADVRALDAAFAAMEACAGAGDRDGFIAADRSFHRRLYAVAGRPRLLARIIDLWDASTRAQPAVHGSWATLADAVADHAPLLAAIRRHDAPGAEAATREHLERAAGNVLAALRAAP